MNSSPANSHLFCVWPGRAIKQSAFGPPASNPYPVIISIEMHCSDKFQEKMTDICLEELGSMIYRIGEVLPPPSPIPPAPSPPGSSAARAAVPSRV